MAMYSRLSCFRGYNQGGQGQADHPQPQELRVWDRERGSQYPPSRPGTGSAQLSVAHPRLAFGEVMTRQCINHSSNKCSLRFFLNKNNMKGFTKTSHSAITKETRQQRALGPPRLVLGQEGGRAVRVECLLRAPGPSATLAGAGPARRDSAYPSRATARSSRGHGSPGARAKAQQSRSQGRAGRVLLGCTAQGRRRRSRAAPWGVAGPRQRQRGLCRVRLGAREEQVTYEADGDGDGSAIHSVSR